MQRVILNRERAGPNIMEIMITEADAMILPNDKIKVFIVKTVSWSFRSFNHPQLCIMLFKDGSLGHWITLP